MAMLLLFKDKKNIRFPGYVTTATLLMLQDNLVQFENTGMSKTSFSRLQNFGMIRHTDRQNAGKGVS